MLGIYTVNLKNAPQCNHVLNVSIYTMLNKSELFKQKEFRHLVYMLIFENRKRNRIKLEEELEYINLQIKSIS